MVTLGLSFNRYFLSLYTSLCVCGGGEGGGGARIILLLHSERETSREGRGEGVHIYDPCPSLFYHNLVSTAEGVA